MVGRAAIRGEVPAATIVWSVQGGRPTCSIVCKLTFDLAPGKLERSRAADPIAEVDAYWNDDRNRSLVAAGDLVPSKPKVDVVLTGHAFAPGGRSTRSVIARLVVGPLDKSIEVLADRSAGPDGTVLHGPKFSQMPLLFERTSGGPRSWNPVGVRPDARDAYGRSSLPNLISAAPATSGAPEPVGFGPIAPRWPGRLEKLGRLAPTFPHETWSAEPLPAGFDFAYFNVAPPDQQLASLKGGETILLENLHRTEPILSTKVPEVRPKVRARRGAGVEPIGMMLDTLVLDTDRNVLVMTWRGATVLDHPAELPVFEIEVESFVASDLEITQGVRNEDPLFATHDTSSLDAPAPIPPPRPSAPGRDAALPFQGAPAGPRPGRLEALPFAPSAAPTTARERPATAPPPASVGAETPWSAPRPPPPPTMALAQPPSPVATPRLAALAADPPPPPAWAPPVTPPSLVTHAAGAALGGVAAASNAASDPRLAPSAHGAKNGGPVRPPPPEILELVWFDPAVTARVKRKPEWKRILDELEQGEFDPEAEAIMAGESEEDADDKRELFEVLTRGTPSGPEKIDDALVEAIRKDGFFAPRLLLVSGEMRFEFEELELLKATVAAATPFATEEDELKKAVDRAAEFLRSPGLVVSPDVARGFTKRVRDAFAAAPRLVQPSYLEEQTERALLERRAYQRRNAFGERHLRGELAFLGMDTGVPTYLPDDLAKKLPMFRRFKARLMAEVHYQEDQYEAYSAAFKAVALARVVR